MGGLRGGCVRQEREGGRGEKCELASGWWAMFGVGGPQEALLQQNAWSCKSGAGGHACNAAGRIKRVLVGEVVVWE